MRKEMWEKVRGERLESVCYLIHLHCFWRTTNQRAERDRKMQNEGRGSATGVLISSAWVSIAAIGRVGGIKLKRRIKDRNRGM